jgi:outer membrane protein assembly factor BamB
MNYNDEFIPENVEEQIDQFTYSLNEEPVSSSAQVIQELHVYYKEDQRSVKRMWERLVPYAAEHAGTLPVSDQSETVNEIFAERMLPRKPGWRSSRKKFAPQLTLIAAIFCTSLVVGSLLFVLQMVHSSHSSSLPPPLASSHSFYITRGGEVSRIDLQTHKTIWHIIVPKFDPGDIGNLVVFHDTVYLSLTSYFYALNTSDGHIRWSNKGLHAYSLSFVDGLLYAQTALDYKEAFYVFNPTNGKVETIYFPPPDQQTWPGPAIVDGIMYSATSTDLYAVTLTNRRVVWHQHYFFGSSPRVIPIEVREVKNGIVYVQATVNTSTKTFVIILTFDARTGKKLWQLNTDDAEILAITDRVIYTTQGQNNLTSSAPLSALDIHTGKLLWYKSINPSKILVTADWYSVIKMLIVSDTLYVSYENKSSVGGVVALNARDGTQLWQANVNEEISDSPLGVQNGVLYTTSYNNNKNSAIDAFKVNDGSRLWHMPLQAGYPWRVIVV